MYLYEKKRLGITAVCYGTFCTAMGAGKGIQVNGQALNSLLPSIFPILPVRFVAEFPHRLFLPRSLLNHYKTKRNYCYEEKNYSKTYSPNKSALPFSAGLICFLTAIRINIQTHLATPVLSPDQSLLVHLNLSPLFYQ